MKIFVRRICSEVISSFLSTFPAPYSVVQNVKYPSEKICGTHTKNEKSYSTNIFQEKSMAVLSRKKTERSGGSKQRAEVVSETLWSHHSRHVKRVSQNIDS